MEYFETSLSAVYKIKSGLRIEMNVNFNESIKHKKKKIMCVQCTLCNAHCACAYTVDTINQ